MKQIKHFILYYISAGTIFHSISLQKKSTQVQEALIFNCLYYITRTVLSTVYVVVNTTYAWKTHIYPHGLIACKISLGELHSHTVCP